MSEQQPILLIHGGAGAWPEERHEACLAALREAVAAGRTHLGRPGGALEACLRAVETMEDDPLFNAGTGAALSIDGSIELDAAVMRGDTLECGAVTALRDVRHPIRVALDVMQKSDHVLLAGEGALRFARSMGHDLWNCEVEGKRRTWEERRARLLRGEDAWLPRLHQLIAEHPELCRGTVGAVARDVSGLLVAATSTGGVVLKLPGRVGDTPLPGAGTWADAFACVSATGRGELVMRALSGRRVAEAVERGASAAQAVAQVLRWMAEHVGSDTGLIALDHRGGWAALHDTPTMPHAWAGPTGAIAARIRQGDATPDTATGVPPH